MLGFRDAFVILIMALLFGSVLLTLCAIGGDPRQTGAIWDLWCQHRRLVHIHLAGLPGHVALVRCLCRYHRELVQEPMILTLGPIPKAQRVAGMQEASGAGHLRFFVFF